ncbi:TetR/AcrR family transcriptional regulator [Aquisediminimonas sediminicola]|uniref:TetR/AcrR family transcriptional regulator n=1 Tax=Alteraquisediminimonas sediminicola TaxID=2676787 RepID=UPI001C8E3F0B|nr:TetR/AcrR family transcriptional regulator [Aquisediminimonas sediminicola]
MNASHKNAEELDVSPQTLTVKEQLILAGEQLFGQKGIEGTSLREIATKAENGNNNAVRYHFGSKEGLIQAIFHYRVAQLEPYRAEMFKIAKAKSTLHDLRTLIEILYLPHLQICDDVGRHPYIAFLLHYLLYYRPKGMMHVADQASPNGPNLYLLLKLLRERFFYLDPDVLERRLLTANVTFFSVVLFHDELTQRLDQSTFREVLSDTLEQIVAAFNTPVRPME